MWNNEQIEQHIEAAQELSKIKDDAFDYIQNKKNISEYRISKFILEKFKEKNLKTDFDPPYVAFGKNTSKPHYPPPKNSKKLEKGNLILIDIWAKLNIPRAPFADITWMAYYGTKIPEEFAKIFNIIKSSRDGCVNFIEKNLRERLMPSGSEIDNISESFIKLGGYGKYIKHCVGHSIGTTTPHGNRSHLYEGNLKFIHKNLGYTIEPGIYVSNKYGMRSEIDFYISNNLEMIVTTDIQKEITLL